MITYSIRKRKDSDEHHIFEGRQTSREPLECKSQPESICRKSRFSETKWIRFSCLSEEQVRMKAATLGRVVCGTCVSHLYATPE